ncbi:MAG: hypothetical protein GWN07_13000 [Actinobacteria bacterium]|nr:hypothetical protein [Actinomycetota bacterium]NIU64023.1 hypothetical protein [Actinomycetota bacterium]NIW25822.1 hypothetical protein [Actinomycetota bacterium]NIX20691.1 hypothetical protein [Actinomycetota bacterium]
MPSTTIGTIRTLLERVMEGVDDPEHRYRLRTALQLLDAHEAHGEHVRLALADADLDEELSATLRDLGYLG